MIEIAGLNPVNSVIDAGLEKFVSLFRNRTSNAYGAEDAGPRAYTKKRGILVEKDAVTPYSINPERAYYFQFNPQTIDDVKNTLYSTREYAGLSYNDYIWSNGGERIISFQLFLDNTPQSKTSFFRPTEYNRSKEAWTLEGDRRGFGQRVGDYAKANLLPRGADMLLKVSDNPKELRFNTSSGAYSKTRIDERGILPEIDIIRSFMMPAVPTGLALPKFSEGGIMNLDQFRPPPTIFLAIGPIFLEGIIKSAPVTYTLFDEDLTPIRGTVDIEFAAFEYEDVSGYFKYLR